MAFHSPQVTCPFLVQETRRVWHREAGRFSRAIRECPALTSVLVTGLCLVWGCVPLSVRGLGHPDRLSLQRLAGCLVLLLDTSQGIKSLLSKERHLKKVGRVCGSCLNRRLSFLSLLVTCVYRFPMSAAFLTNDALHPVFKKEPMCVAPSPPCPPCFPLCPRLSFVEAGRPRHRPSCSSFSARVPLLGFPSWVVLLGSPGVWFPADAVAGEASTVSHLSLF